MSESVRKQARGAFLNFNFAVAETLYSQYRANGGNDIGAILHLAICREISGDKIAAKKLYKEYSLREGGSDALKENVRGRAMFQLDYPRTPSVYTNIARDNAVVMSRLIGWGRFGNQILEHFWLHLHATNHNLKMAVSYWLGRDLFGLANFVLTNAGDFIEKSEEDLAMADAIKPTGPSFSGHNVVGFCQIHTKHTSAYKNVFKSLYRPIEPLEKDLNRFLHTVRGDAKNLVVVHLRRTDYVGTKYDIGGVDWIKEWLHRVIKNLSASVVYIASDDPGAVDEFGEFNAVSNRDFDFSVSGAEFMPDWWVLAHADVLAIANSTFSLTAAMFNSTAKLMVRPSLERKSMDEFDPWDTHVLDENA